MKTIYAVLPIDWGAETLPKTLAASYFGWLHETRESAEAACLEGQDIYPRHPWAGKVHVVEITPENNLPLICSYMFETGEWKHPPWSDKLTPVHLHFAHISETDPTQIAFVVDLQKGARWIFTRMKPGRYLKKYYPGLTPKQIEYYARWWLKGEQPELGEGFTLAFASTPEEIVHVYAHGPDSCMANQDYVKVYGAGDLAVAYLTYSNESEAIICARVLCWPEKKVYSRVYACDVADHAADSSADELIRRLHADGFEADELRNTRGLNGARLLKIAHDGSWVMPYIDHYAVDNRGEHFVIASDGEYAADNTAGLIEEFEYECDHCARGFREIWTVYTPAEEAWCENCTDHHALICEWDRLIYSDELPVVQVFTRIGHSFDAPEYVMYDKPDSFFKCIYDGEWWLADSESEKFPGYPSEYDDFEDAHPELKQEQLELGEAVG